MKLFVSAAVAMSIASPLFAQTTCPNKAVFLVLPDQVRGYAAAASGSTLPCQTISGTNTTLQDGNAIAVSSHGYVRVTQFNNGVAAYVFAPTANGNVAPYRVEGVGANDLISIATDNTNDFVATENGGGQMMIAVTTGSTPKGTFAVPGIFATGGVKGGLAVDPGKNLLAAGYGINGEPEVVTLGTSANLTSPSVVRVLSGPATGLLASDQSDYVHNPMSIAVDPATGEIYVYTYSNTTQTQQISVFASQASGNVAPLRVISGSKSLFGAPGLKNNKIAVGSDGRLYVAESNNMILVFAAGANGNVPPAQILYDTTAPANAAYGQAGIAVRN